MTQQSDTFGSTAPPVALKTPSVSATADLDTPASIIQPQKLTQNIFRSDDVLLQENPLFTLFSFSLMKKTTRHQNNYSSVSCLDKTWNPRGRQLWSEM